MRNKFVNLLKEKVQQRQLKVRAGRDYRKVATLKLGLGNPFPDEEDRILIRINRKA